MKEYKKPHVMVVNIECENILTGSPRSYDEQGNDSWHSASGMWVDMENDNEN